MLFTIIVLAIVITVAGVRASKSQLKSVQPVHTPLEEIEVPTAPEESYVEVETVPTVKVMPTTPPSAPTMTSKKKNTPSKKKPSKTKQ